MQGRGRAATRHTTRPLSLAGAGVLVLSVLGSMVAGLLVGGSALLPPPLHAALGGWLYPLLFGTTLLILLRDQLRVARYGRLQRWLRRNRRTPCGLLLLYVLVMAMTVVVALLTGGEALLLRLVVT